VELAVMGLIVTVGALWNRWLIPQFLPDLGKERWVPFFRFVGSALAIAGVVVAVIGVVSAVVS
jgi:hypothetical protein